MCGATAFSTPRGLPRQGLSPRVRGNHQEPGHRHGAPGPIPACAGQPSSSASCSLPTWAYPRVCGATQLTPADSRSERGLSPRVRGNRMTVTEGAAPVGPIPACAGQPRGGDCRSSLMGAYPRVCGATVQTQTEYSANPGLSPRVRGNRRFDLHPPRNRGPIPACAGQPARWRVGRIGQGAYPRVCGATLDGVEQGGGVKGLSPRVRGNRGLRAVCFPPWRPIPACAGQPSFLRRAGL